MKSLKKNYIYNLSYQILVMFMPLIITPYLSRTLGAENIGIHSFTVSIVSYFILFGGLGINLYGQREIAKVQDNKDKRSKKFWELVILKSIFLFFSLLIYIIFNISNDLYNVYYQILIIELISSFFDITWFYQGMEDFKKITIRNVLVKIAYTISIFIFVKSPKDLILYFLIYSVSNFLGYLILWFKLNKYVSKVDLKKLNVFSHLKSVLTLFIPQIAIQIYTVLDKTMIGLILDDMNEVGYYEQSQKVVKMCLMVITSLGTVMVPRISNLYSSGKHNELNQKIFKVFNIVSIIAFPMCFGLIGISANFVPWFFGQEFLPITELLCIFSFLLLGIGFNNITGMQYLIPTDNQKVFTISVTIGAIINFILNLCLIPFFGGIGAAFSTVIAEFIIFIVQLIYLRKVINFKKIFLYNFRYLIYSVIMFAFVYIIGMGLNANILSTMIQIIVGGIVYLLLLIITKDSFIIEIFKIVKKIVKR